MKPIRFLIAFFGVYLMNLFFSFLTLRLTTLAYDPRVAVVMLVLSQIIFGLGVWLYFRGVRTIGWKTRVEVVLVWFLLGVLLDALLIPVIFQFSIGLVVSSTALAVYFTQIVILVVFALIMTPKKEALHSPDLLV